MPEWLTPDTEEITQADVGTVLLFQNELDTVSPGKYPDAFVVIIPAPQRPDVERIWVRRLGAAPIGAGAWADGFWANPRELSPVPANCAAILDR